MGMANTQLDSCGYTEAMKGGVTVLILKPSRIHGVGVFTTAAIRKGTKLPLFERGDWKCVRRVTGVLRRYCPVKKYGYYAPRNVHRMSIGWYLNHGKKPNVDARNWRALHYIPAGKELAIDYAFFDEYTEAMKP
ncbi:MAG: SET domain-containing protein [Candidatus Hydrogenedentales bacterium]|jgi:hypothetical protein